MPEDIIETTVEETAVARKGKLREFLDRAATKNPDGTVNPGHCTAQYKDGNYCVRPAVSRRGMTVCVFHGGKNAIGIHHGRFESGRYCNVLPKKLAARAEAARNDPELLSCREDVALLHARLEELCSQLDSGESASLWADLRNQVNRLDMATTDAERLAVAASMKVIIEKGSNNEKVWEQIHFTLEHKTKTSAQEWKRLVDLQQVITAERAVALMTRITDAVLRHVPEPDRRSLIAKEMKSIMNLGGPDREPPVD